MSSNWGMQPFSPSKLSFQFSAQFINIHYANVIKMRVTVLKSFFSEYAKDSYDKVRYCIDSFISGFAAS